MSTQHCTCREYDGSGIDQHGNATCDIHTPSPVTPYKGKPAISMQGSEKSLTEAYYCAASIADTPPTNNSKD